MKKLVFYALLIGLMAGCYNPNDTLKYLYENKKAEMESMAHYVRGIPSIGDIFIYDDRCDWINGWKKCSPNDTLWSYHKFPEEKIYLSTVEEVLEREGIDKAVFTYITGKMKEWKINELRRTDDYVDFRITLYGLRYYFEKEHEELKEDYEYLEVIKLDAQWYLHYVNWM